MGNVVVNFWQLYGLRFTLAASVFSISIVSLGIVFHWDRHRRDVPAWMWWLVAALAAVTVASMAVYVSRWRDQKRGAKRALWRAERAAIRVDYETSSDGGSTSPVAIQLTNRGPTELYEVKWWDPLIVYGRTDSVTRTTEATITGARWPFAEHQLLPGQSRRVFLRCDSHDGERKPLTGVIPLVAFRDADGNRIGRVLGRGGTPPFQSKWAIVDDGYPATVGGGLGRLLNRLERRKGSILESVLRKVRLRR